MNLIAAAIIGIAVIVLLIAACKVHPFLSLLAGSFVMAVCAGVPFDKAFDSFTSGVGGTISNVGLLIAFGSIIGTILFKSGGADTIVDTIMAKTPLQRLPWAMALIAFIVGIPMFFEVGVVILIPVVLFAARRSKSPVVLLGIPALAGLSTLHAFVPPHPGPLTAIGALNANLGITLALGLIVAIPTVIISGPLFGRLAAKWVPIAAPENEAEAEAPKSAENRPSFGTALSVILLPVVLMLAASIVDLTGQNTTAWGRVIAFLGTPLVALLITTVFAMVALGYMQKFSRDAVNGMVGQSFGSVAGIILIVAAGRRLQADAGRLRHRRRDRQLHHRIRHEPADRRLAGGRAHPSRHRFGNRGDRHRLRHHGAARRRHEPDPSGTAGAGHRRRLRVLLPPQRRRLLAGQGILRHERGPDAEDLVADGNHSVGGRPGLRDAALAGALTH